MLWSYDLLILTWPRLLHQPLIINDGTIGLHYVMKTRPSRWSVQRIHEQIFLGIWPQVLKTLSLCLSPASFSKICPAGKGMSYLQYRSTLAIQTDIGQIPVLPSKGESHAHKHPAWASTFFCESLRDGNRDRFNAWQLDNKRGHRDNFPFGRLGLSCI